MLRFFACLLLLFTAACDQKPAEEEPKLILQPASFNDLPAWDQDDLSGFQQAFTQSCTVFFKKAGDQIFTFADYEVPYSTWHNHCAALSDMGEDKIRPYLENNFEVFAVTNNGQAQGLFTGYYEASLHGSLTRSAEYNIPLHKRPDDLVMVHLGEFRESLKGQRIAGRVKNGTLKPYEDRSEIINGNWPYNDKDHVLVWVNDPVDAFFVQIQGSGLVELDDGSLLRAGYAGQNGHPYYAIGRSLIAREEIAKEDMSLQAIRDWLTAHPDQADALMNENKSYVFFRQLDKDGPIGGQNVPLTPRRSLAIDRTLIPYGSLLYLDADAPKEGAAPIKKLMIAQDTGGAIRGPVRGDVFWGHGAEAESLAGPMKSKGRYWALLPK